MLVGIEMLDFKGINRLLSAESEEFCGKVGV